MSGVAPHAPHQQTAHKLQQQAHTLCPQATHPPLRLGPPELMQVAGAHRLCQLKVRGQCEPHVWRSELCSAPWPGGQWGGPDVWVGGLVRGPAGGSADAAALGSPQAQPL